MTAAHSENQGYPQVDWIYSRPKTRKWGGYYPFRQLRVAWGSADNLVSELFTHRTSYPYNSSGAKPYRAKITPYPGCKAQSGGDGIATYDYALVTVWYTTDLFYDGDLLSEKFSIWTDKLRAWNEDLEWADGTSVSQSEAAFRIDCGAVYELTYYDYTFIPSAIITYAGLVNNNTVLTRVTKIPLAPYTMLYRGAIIETHVKYGEGTRYNITLPFSIKQGDGYGWRGQYRASTGRYELMYDGDGVVITPPNAAFGFI